MKTREQIVSEIESVERELRIKFQWIARGRQRLLTRRESIVASAAPVEAPAVLRHKCEFCSSLSMKRSRCARLGIPFDLTCDYVRSLMPPGMICPVLGVRMLLSSESGRRVDRASIDRIRPELGYIRGNVAMISVAANTIKGNHTDPSIFRRMADWMESMIR